MHNHHLKIVRLVFALITMIAFAACVGTTRSAGTQVDDSAIHTKVKARLTNAHFSNINNIDINVTNGVVTLAGEVRDQRVKEEAEREARKVDGVVDVHNNLQVEAQATLSP
jgi:osmotically-inducible protein OsmY